MKKKLKLTNENVRFLDNRTLQTIRGGTECTRYCVLGDDYYNGANPTNEVTVTPS